MPKKKTASKKGRKRKLARDDKEEADVSPPKKRQKRAKADSKHKKPPSSATRYWLMKSEPAAYSIDDLQSEGEAGDYWDGIRNYQVRNMIRDEIRTGDLALFYHSCCKPPGVAGTMTVLKDCYPDFTAFDRSQKYFDPKSDPENPRWFMFDVGFRSKFKRFVTLNELKSIKKLENLKALQKGNRLSITEITEQEFQCIERLGNPTK